MVFNRSKYLRGREGPQKKGGWGLGRVVVEGEDGERLLFLFASTCMPHLQRTNSTTVQDPGLGNASANIYCLPLNWSW